MIKTHMKRVEAAIEANDPDRAKEEYRLACKKIDKAAARRIIHPNSAARKKSKLAQKLARLAQQTAQQP
jgi:small subunit ribosomal protein S20